jgi:hypothetical protein
MTSSLLSTFTTRSVESYCDGGAVGAAAATTAGSFNTKSLPSSINSLTSAGDDEFSSMLSTKECMSNLIDEMETLSK